MLPFAALDRGFNGISRCYIWQHDKSVAKVFIDVSARKCIHLVSRLTEFQPGACRRRNQLRSASRRALKRSAHFLEQSAVRQQ
jgi:hypothetical protein